MKDLLLLHGALGAASQFDELKARLSGKFNVHTFDFYGHGKNDSDGPLSIDWFSLQLNRVVAANGLSNPCVFGYSMGGYVALNCERTNQVSFEKIVTLGTKFGWDPESSKKEAGYLNPDVIMEKIPHYGQYLESLHPGIGWRNLLIKTADMMLDLGENPILSNSDLSGIECDVKLMLGSEDRMVSVDETKEIAGRIDGCKFQSLDGVPHPIDKIETSFLEELISKEFSDVL